MKTIHSKRHKRLVQILIDERKKAGIRQVELAQRLKRSQTWVARMEGRGRRIDVVEFLALAEIIGFDAAKIIGQLLREK